MDSVELYNKKYFGKQFKSNYSDEIYTFGQYNGGCVYIFYNISHDTVERQVHELDNVFRAINNGAWVLYLNEERKQKLKKLMEQ